MRANSARTAFLPLAALVCATAACKSSAEHRRDADREAYELVRSRRAAIADGDLEFTIEPDPARLGARLRRGEETAVAKLDLAAALEIAAENSREFQTRREALYIAALDLTLERWAYSVQTGGTLAAAIDGVDGEATSVSTGGTGFSLGKLFGTGATVLGSIGLNASRSLLTSEGWSTITDVSLGVTQPLLAGAGESIVLEPLTQAERDLVYAVRDYERFRRTFAFDVASRFYRILQSSDQVRNQAVNLSNLKELSARNLALAEAGRLDAIELGQARQNELRSENDLLDVEARHQSLLDQFKLFLGLPVEVALELDDASLADLAQAVPEEALEPEHAARIALGGRLDYVTVREREEDAARQVLVAEDALQGLLDLNANVGATSVEGEAFDFDAVTWGVGFDWDLPFERLPQRNRWRAALIAREAAARDTEEARDQIVGDVRDDLRSTRTNYEGWRIQLNAVELADKRIENAKLQLDAGRASTRDLLEAQESLLTARNAATAALIDYTLARMGLYLDMELLRLGPDGIELLPPPAAEEGA